MGQERDKTGRRRRMANRNAVGGVLSMKGASRPGKRIVAERAIIIFPPSPPAVGLSGAKKNPGRTARVVDTAAGSRPSAVLAVRAGRLPTRGFHFELQAGPAALRNAGLQRRVRTQVGGRDLILLDGRVLGVHRVGG